MEILNSPLLTLDSVTIIQVRQGYVNYLPEGNFFKSNRIQQTTWLYPLGPVSSGISSCLAEMLAMARGPVGNTLSYRTTQQPHAGHRVFRRG